MSAFDNYIFDLDETVTRTPVSFTNRYGITISADLYHAKDLDTSQQSPAVVIGPPYSGVKEQSPGLYAQEMAKRGFVALAIDPSYNGFSGGEPRHVSSPDLFVEDFSAGVDFVGTRPFVDRDRVGAIGVCGSGGFALTAAQVDRRIKAVAAVVMYDIGRLTERGFLDSVTDEQRSQTLDALAQQRYTDFETGTPALNPRFSPLDIDENTDPVSREFGEFYFRGRGYHPNSIGQFTLSSALAFMNFPLLSKLEWISPRPILLVTGEHAHSKYFSDDAYKAAAEPKELYVVPNAGHVDLYDKLDLIPFDKLEEFFTKSLA